MTWAGSVQVRADGPLPGAHRPMQEAYPNWQRTTLGNTCAGLTGQELASRSPAKMSLPILRAGTGSVPVSNQR